MTHETAPAEGGSDDRSATSDRPDDTAGAHVETGPRADLEQVVQSFDLFGFPNLDADLRVGLTSALHGHGWHTRHFAAADFKRDGAAAAWVDSEVGTGRDVYSETSAVSLETANRLERSGGRGTDDDRIAALMVAVDADTLRLDDALSASRAVTFRPTAVVATGTPGHAQLVYVLAPPLRLDADPSANGAGRAALLRRRERVARALAVAVDDALPSGALDGGADHVDAVHDLSRIIRIPGTYNAKRVTQ